MANIVRLRGFEANVGLKRVVARFAKHDEVLARRRPSLAALLIHPVRNTDNGTPPAGYALALDAGIREKGLEGVSDFSNWVVHHAQVARFYLGGLESVKGITGSGQARYYYGFVERAAKIAAGQEWRSEMRGTWGNPVSYNQFRKALIFGEPMFFDIATQILVACECAMELAIQEGRYDGDKFDVYKLAKVIPACYNIDLYTEATLEKLRAQIPNYDSDVLAAAGQRSTKLLNSIARGACVTRNTARAIRWRTLRLAYRRGMEDVQIGDVRGRPGRTRLGRGSAASDEIVELDDLRKHIESPTQTS